MKPEGSGPRYVQRGKFIRYRQIDLDAFIEANLQSGNSGDTDDSRHDGIHVKHGEPNEQDAKPNRQKRGTQRKDSISVSYSRHVTPSTAGAASLFNE